MDKNLNVRPKAIKLLKENKANFHNIEFDILLKAKATATKNSRQIKLNNFLKNCISKDSIDRLQRQQNGGKYFQIIYLTRYIQNI